MIAIIMVITGVPFAFAGVMPADDHVVSGVITDELGEPVIGATVLEAGTTNGVITDIDGKYTINIKSKSPSIQITYIVRGIKRNV